MIRIVVLLLLAASTVFAQCPMHDEHAAGVEQRGDHAMGFDHAKTTHHFLLQKDGGIIQVTANSADDQASRDAIRMHLKHIATMFSEGNFETPMFIHDRVPPGIPVLKEKKDQVHYQYEDIDNGGRVVISTSDEAALGAVHEFLKFQIEDHHTGDPEKLTE